MGGLATEIIRELMDRTEDERTRQLFRRLLDELENS